MIHPTSLAAPRCSLRSPRLAWPAPLAAALFALLIGWAPPTAKGQPPSPAEQEPPAAVAPQASGTGQDGANQDVSGDDLPRLEQQAMQAAAAAVAESVVRIQTVGGLEQLGDVALAAGPTTGLVVSEDGLIVSSAFNFAQRPASILVTLSDGETAPAEIVATDNSRMLVLLRIRTSRPLVAARAVERDAMAVGQWAIAVGRSYPGPTPSISVGVVSALDRITSKVLQTDAKISPVNYGGPLVDIHGRVLGVLVPMSPQGSGPVAGVEWYDSGIGFAVPLADVYRVLPRMAAGSDLHPGVLGVSLARGDSYVLPAVIEVVRPKSPASEAGLAAGDRIVAIGGSAIETQMQMRNAIGRYYAGDTIPIAAVRGEERIEREVTLAERLEPFQHAFFGVLPMRMAADGAGVPVRDVYPDGPAARGGIQAGDRITAIAEAPVTTIEQALAEMNRLEAGTETSVTFEREGASQTIRWTAASLPEEIPSVAPLALPAADRPAAQAQPGAIGDGPMEAGQLEVGQLEVGQFDLNLPDTPDGAVVYVPEGYDANIAHGLVLWCHPGGMLDGGALVGRLKAHCDERNLILVAPRTTQGGDWSPTDLERIRRLLDTIQNTYTIDSRRIVAVGRQSGGAPASVLAIEDRDRVRGLAVVEAALPAATPGQGLVNEPTQRLAFYSAAASGTPLAARIATAAGRLRAEKFPVTTRELGMAPRDLSDEELAELVRWIDTLDRF